MTEIVPYENDGAVPNPSAEPLAPWMNGYVVREVEYGARM
jgi:hypothetical protein